MTLEEIQKLGAEARAQGRGEFDNPYYKAQNMPAKTGETIPEWEAKLAAWHFGWIMEDAIRG